MYIIIITEYLSNSDDAGHSETVPVDREVLVNINCPIKMILNYIRKIACIGTACK